MTTPPAKNAGLVDRLPSHLRGRLPVDLEAALNDIAVRGPWQEHPVDIRLSIPLLFRRFYVTIVAGPERRSRERRAVDRRNHRLASLGNALFVLAVAVVCAAVIGAATLLATLFD